MTSRCCSAKQFSENEMGWGMVGGGGLIHYLKEEFVKLFQFELITTNVYTVCSYNQ